MTQTLTAFPAITSPIKTSDANTLSGNVAQIQNLDNRQTLAFAAYCLTYLLHEAGGTDYRTNLKQLRQDVTSMMGTFQPMGEPSGGALFSKIIAVILWDAAFAADSTLGTNVGTILTSADYLRETPESVLWQYILFLLYALAIHSV